MAIDFVKIKNRRYNFTSKFNVRLYKKCLSLKLLLSNKNIKFPNIFSGENSKPVKLVKKIYARRELVPLRLLRFFYLLDYSILVKLGIKFLVAKKLSVYRGNIAKFINVNRDY